MRFDILNRLGVDHECDGQTDGQTYVARSAVAECCDVDVVVGFGRYAAAAPRAITGRHGDNRWRQDLAAPFDSDTTFVMMNAVRAIHSVQSAAHRLSHKVSRSL